MLHLIQNHHRSNYIKTIDEMHKKRYEVFHIDLGWEVPVKDGREIDQYDIDSAVYAVSYDENQGVVGGVRFLPTTGPNMIKDIFPHLVDHHDLIPNDPKIWEATRLFYKKTKDKNDTVGLARKGTIEIFIGMLEFGVTWELTGLLVLTDLRIEKLFHNSGWNLKRIGAPTDFNGKKYVVGILPISKNILKTVREKTSMHSPVLMSSLPICSDNLGPLDLGFKEEEDFLLAGFKKNKKKDEFQEKNEHLKSLLKRVPSSYL